MITLSRSLSFSWWLSLFHFSSKKQHIGLSTRSVLYQFLPAACVASSVAPFENSACLPSLGSEA